MVIAGGRGEAWEVDVVEPVMLSPAGCGGVAPAPVQPAIIMLAVSFAVNGGLQPSSVAVVVDTALKKSGAE